MKWMAMCLVLLMVAVPAMAGGLAGLSAAQSMADLPDPAELLEGGAMLYDENILLEDGSYGIAYTYSMPDDLEQFLEEYGQLLEEAGYAVSASQWQRQPAALITCMNRSAWLVPAYKGSLMLAIMKEIPFLPLPTPQPTAVPRVTPAPVPGGGYPGAVSGPRDCFACVGGVCSLCNGTGWYRMYGEKVECSPSCTTCGGTGTW